MLDLYNELRKTLLEKTADFPTYCSNMAQGRVVESLQELQKKLLENRFHLVVIGQFERGKSTFINSILGDPVLPTSVVPLTSIVTILKYGEEESVQVMFHTNTTRAL
jgi:ribosome biogenesis GTPase A